MEQVASRIAALEAKLAEVGTRGAGYGGKGKQKSILESRAINQQENWDAKSCYKSNFKRLVGGVNSIRLGARNFLLALEATVRHGAYEKDPELPILVFEKGQRIGVLSVTVKECGSSLTFSGNGMGGRQTRGG